MSAAGPLVHRIPSHRRTDPPTEIPDRIVPVQPFDFTADHPDFTVVVARWPHGEWSTFVFEEGIWMMPGYEGAEGTTEEILRGATEVWVVARPVAP